MTVSARSLQRGGTLIGILIGIVIGLAAAVVTALVVTKTAVPFIGRKDSDSSVVGMLGLVLFVT